MSSLPIEILKQTKISTTTLESILQTQFALSHIIDSHRLEIKEILNLDFIVNSSIENVVNLNQNRINQDIQLSTFTKMVHIYLEASGEYTKLGNVCN